MRLLNKSQCVVWGSLAALISCGSANPNRDIPAAIARADASPLMTSADITAAEPADAPVAAVGAEADEKSVLGATGPSVAAAEYPAGFALASLEVGNLAKPEEKVIARAPGEACVLSDECIDRYLWSIYERTPKLDTAKIVEHVKVTIKKKGKNQTVTKATTKFVNEDFAWKDPQAAEKVGMSMPDYVIGGMERSFKRRLYQLIRAMDDAGLAPGITSGFRDDYRQSIATGNKAANERSYHGGTLRGGYGHGIAADLVSVQGATRAERMVSSEKLWQWIDAHGPQFGLARPYLDFDPPHIAPIDGKEYADKRGGQKTKRTKS